MKGIISDDGTVKISRRKLILLGSQAKPLFNRSPVLIYMKGALSNLPPARKEKKIREIKVKPDKVLYLLILCAVFYAQCLLPQLRFGFPIMGIFTDQQPSLLLFLLF